MYENIVKSKEKKQNYIIKLIKIKKIPDPVQKLKPLGINHACQYFGGNENVNKAYFYFPMSG